MRSITTRFSLLAAAMGLVLAGCGGGDEVDTYHLSGNVTFDGKPIPKGKIYFMPDGSKGNSGVAGYAEIKDGKFDTKLPGGKGHASGAMKVKIEGLEASGAELDEETGEELLTALFPSYETTADLPKEESTQDFNVPAEAADVVHEEEGGGRGP